MPSDKFSTLMNVRKSAIWKWELPSGRATNFSKTLFLKEKNFEMFYVDKYYVIITSTWTHNISKIVNTTN